MERTQIYLSSDNKRSLAELSSATGDNVSELIRHAVEQFLESQQHVTKKREKHKEKVFAAAFGIWHDNDTDFEAIRRSADRDFS